MRTERQVLGRLYLLYATTNDTHFAGLLPMLPVTLDRLTKKKAGQRRVGTCEWDGNCRPRRVKLDREFALTAAWPLVRDVLLHEMVHVWQGCMGYGGYHDAGFRRMARRLGIKPGGSVD